MHPNLVLGERGFPLIARRRWAIGSTDLKNKTVLVQGTGNGWDLFSWASFGPKKLIGIDLFDFESWSEIEDSIRASFDIDVEFHKSPLDELPFIANESVDLCASDAVFEHVTNLDCVLKETFRILRPGGTVYASYGPLWYCAGGDHFSGRGGIVNAFNHILLGEDDYRDYFDKYKKETEDFQSGGRYVDLGLFSKLRTEEYLELFRSSGFVVDGLILQLSKQALMFKRCYSESFHELLEKNSECTKDDLVVKTNLVRLRKPAQPVL